MTTSIDIQRSNHDLTEGESINLLDVRRRADADANPKCIVGAVHWNPEKMGGWLKALPEGKLAVLHCVKGAQSAGACPKVSARRALKSVLPASCNHLTATRNGCNPSWETIHPIGRPIYAYRR